MTKFIADSPVITAVQKATRRSRKKGRHANGAYWTLGAQAIVFPIIVLNNILDVANAKLEAYIAEQKAKETK